MSDGTPARSGVNIWLAIAFVLSLALNAYVIGTFVGAKAASDRWLDRAHDRFGEGPPPRMDQGVPPELDPRRLGRMLPESARDEAMALFEEHDAELRALFGEAIRARVTAYEVMRADPFDADALREAFAASRAADAAAQEAAHELTVQIIAGLTPEERAEIEANIEERHPGLHHFRDRDDHRGGFHERREERREDRRDRWHERREERREEWRERRDGEDEPSEE